MNIDLYTYICVHIYMYISERRQLEGRHAIHPPTRTGDYDIINVYR